jgi:hypothetical protein
VYLLIRHELSKQTKANEDEVAVAEARNRQRDAQLRKKSEEPSHATGTIYLTHKQKRGLKIGRRLGNTSQEATSMKANDAIGLSLRKHGKATVAYSVRALSF